MPKYKIPKQGIIKELEEVKNGKLEELLTKKEFQQLFEKYPYCRDFLRKYDKPVREVNVEQIRPDIMEGSQYSYDSGFNYFSSTMKHQDMYIHCFDIWQEESDKDTEITFYIPEAQHG